MCDHCDRFFATVVVERGHGVRTYLCALCFARWKARQS
jgi:hypothetical protein